MRYSYTSFTPFAGDLNHHFYKDLEVQSFQIPQEPSSNLINPKFPLRLMYIIITSSRMPGERSYFIAVGICYSVMHPAIAYTIQSNPPCSIVTVVRRASRRNFHDLRKVEYYQIYQHSKHNQHQILQCPESELHYTVGIVYSIAPIIQSTIWIYYLCKFGNCRDRRARRNHPDHLIHQCSHPTLLQNFYCLKYSHNSCPEVQCARRNLHRRGLCRRDYHPTSRTTHSSRRPCTESISKKYIKRDQIPSQYLVS